MKRAVITGVGIVSSLGNNKTEVLDSLQVGRSGIAYNEQFAEFNMRSHVSGQINIDPKQHIDRKVLRFMGNAAAYNYIAMQEAIADADLTSDNISNPRTGLIAGSGGASSSQEVLAVETGKTRGVKKMGPYVVPKTMGSTCSANLATAFKIKGINFSISSACATSAHCIGQAVEQIQLGKQDIIFAGGGEEIDWTSAAQFDAMGALSTKFNDRPQQASRTYDTDRDGFVISGGGGILVIEELEHALSRNAQIYAEIVGYAANSDGHDMVAPSGEGAIRCMQLALNNIEGPIDYLNTHGTSTPVGDTKELMAIREVFGDNAPKISSTKSLSGHALGAAGVHEAIYTLLMMQHHFIAPSSNIEQLDPDASGLPIVTKTTPATITQAMSNSFGFGGTNAVLVFKKH